MFTREKSYFPRATPEWNDYFEGEQIFISLLCKGNECFIPPGQRFGEFCQMKSFCHLCLQNYYFGTLLELYDQSVESWEFRLREIRYCWERNTMLLRGKYDVLMTWDCFNQSNFYISIIIIIEWNNIQLFNGSAGIRSKYFPRGIGKDQSVLLHCTYRTSSKSKRNVK